MLKKILIEFIIIEKQKKMTKKLDILIDENGNVEEV